MLSVRAEQHQLIAGLTMWRLLLPVCFAVTTAILVHDYYPAEAAYNFVYTVNDPVTHDMKKQWERRVGDRVEGSYRFAEADGTLRIVDYRADGKNGFTAVVRREGRAHHQPIAPISPVGQPVNPGVRPRLLLPLTTAQSPAGRGYFGATFVQENDYGRGQGFL